MNENIPPIPLAPLAPEPQYQPQPYPAPPPEGYDQPAYPAPVQPQHAAPASHQDQPQQYWQPQGYAAPGPYPQPQYAPYPPQQYASTAPWAPAGLRKPKSSGHRVAAGIVGILLGTWLFIPSIAGFGEGGAGLMSFLILVAALGNITAGVVLLAHQRNRNQGPPMTSLSFAGLSLLLGLIGMAVPYFGVALLLTSLILAAPVLIVMGIGLSREKRGA